MVPAYKNLETKNTVNVVVNAEGNYILAPFYWFIQSRSI